MAIHGAAKKARSAIFLRQDWNPSNCAWHARLSRSSPARDTLPATFRWTYHLVLQKLRRQIAKCSHAFAARSLPFPLRVDDPPCRTSSRSNCERRSDGWFSSLSALTQTLASGNDLLTTRAPVSDPDLPIPRRSSLLLTRLTRTPLTRATTRTSTVHVSRMHTLLLSSFSLRCEVVSLRSREARRCSSSRVERVCSRAVCVCVACVCVCIRAVRSAQSMRASSRRSPPASFPSPFMLDLFRLDLCSALLNIKLESRICQRVDPDRGCSPSLEMSVRVLALR